jgi:hypothetical protein
MPAAWKLQPQLERDTASFGDRPLSRGLVINDANFPQLLLVLRGARQCGAAIARSHHRALSHRYGLAEAGVGRGAAARL